MTKAVKTDLRERILETSRDMMVEEGFRMLSMRKIARKVGVSATSIYLHFDNKDELLHTLMDEAIEELNERLQQAARRDGTRSERLLELARTYIEFGIQHPRKYQIIYQVRGDEMQRYPRDKFRRARRGYQLVRAIIGRRNKAAGVDEPDPEMAAYVFWAELHGVMSVVLSGRLDIKIERHEFIEQSLKHIIRGLNLSSEKSGRAK